MKCLSLTQPWATLVILGEKAFETRSWQTAYKGPLAIHASKGFPKEAKELCKESPFREVLHKHGLLAHMLPLGAVLGIVELKGCCRVETVEEKISDQEWDFGNYDAGRFAWHLANPAAFDVPIPEKGALQLWEWNQ